LPEVSDGNPVEGPVPLGVDPFAYDQLRRRVLWAMPTGLYVLGSRAGEDANLMTTSLCVQIATSPKLIATSIEIEAKTLQLVRHSGVFTLAFLAKEDRALVRKFVKPANFDQDKRQLNGIDVVFGEPSGAPVPSVARAYLDCAVEREIAFSSHALVIGEVVNAVVLDPEHFAREDILSMADVKMSYGG
jgi:flavin reductase (DIM6/NTAB) family NADH-FMN oxidoreductase RutF